MRISLNLSHFMCKLSFSIFLIFILAFLPRPFALAEEAKRSPEEKLIYTLKNHDALPRDRTAALDQLMKLPPEGLETTLLELMQDPNEIDLRIPLMKAMSSAKDEHFIQAVQKIFLDRRADLSTRQTALYVLLEMDFDKMFPVLKQVVQDSYDLEPLRKQTLDYLQQQSARAEVQTLVTEIFSDRNESPGLRKNAVSVALLGPNPKMLLPISHTILFQPKETVAMREFAVTIYEQLKAPGLDDDLLKILGNPKEKSAAKKMVLQKLSGRKNQLEPYLPQLKQLYNTGGHLGIDMTLRKQLKNLIKEIEKTIKPALVPPKQLN